MCGVWFEICKGLFSYVCVYLCYLGVSDLDVKGFFIDVFYGFIRRDGV